MSQLLASTRLPVPNIILPNPWLGDHGTLFIRTGKTWHVWDGHKWQDKKAGLTTPELYRHYNCKSRPPSNVDDGWAGIAPGPFSQNWTKKDLAAAFTQFMAIHKEEYIPADGCCWDPLKKARLLKRTSDQKAARRLNEIPAALIYKAAPDLIHV